MTTKTTVTTNHHNLIGEGTPHTVAMESLHVPPQTSKQAFFWQLVKINLLIKVKLPKSLNGRHE
jgi:hypothetical protein